MITSPAEHARRREMYDAHMTDQELSDAWFICINAVKYWRESQEPPLPPNSKKCEKIGEREALYDQGLTDTEIAHTQQCSRMAIRHWRKKHDLEQNKPSKGELAHASC